MTGIRWVANGPGGLDDFAAVPCEPTDPAPGELTVRITAAGVNPADLKHLARITDAADFPAPIGYELAGVVTAVGAGTRAGSGRVRVGDRIAAFRVHGAYAAAMTIPAEKAFVLGPDVPDDQAAGLLLAGCTAAEMLTRSGARAGDTVLFHGASGSVGAIFLQLAAMSDVAVVGTAGPDRLGAVEQFGGVPVVYGPGLAERVQRAAPAPVVAALDAAGTAEATEVSLSLVDDRSRVITVADKRAAVEHGFIALSGAASTSAAYRDGVRGELLKLLAAGELVVPIAHRLLLTDAVEALRLVSSGRAHGTVVLAP